MALRYQRLQGCLSARHVAATKPDRISQSTELSSSFVADAFVSAGDQDCSSGVHVFVLQNEPAPTVI